MNKSYKCNEYRKKQFLILQSYLIDNAKLILAPSDGDMIFNENIYHYNSATVEISEIRDVHGEKIILNVVSDDDSKEKEVFNKLERLLLGRK